MPKHQPFAYFSNYSETTSHPSYTAAGTPARAALHLDGRDVVPRGHHLLLNQEVHLHAVLRLIITFPKSF